MTDPIPSVDPVTIDITPEAVTVSADAVRSSREHMTAQQWRPLETTDAPKVETTALIPYHVVTDEAPRCWRCRRKLAELVSRPWRCVCPRCKAVNSSAQSNSV